jgi:hypothetical protein
MRVSIASRSGSRVTIGAGSPSVREVLVTLSSRHKVHSVINLRISDFLQPLQTASEDIQLRQFFGRTMDSSGVKSGKVFWYNQGTLVLLKLKRDLGRMKFTKYAQMMVLRTIGLNLLYRARSRDYDMQHNVYMLIPEGFERISRYFAPEYDLDRGEPSSLAVNTFSLEGLTLDTFDHSKYSLSKAQGSVLDDQVFDWFKGQGYL